MPMVDALHTVHGPSCQRRADTLRRIESDPIRADSREAQ